LWLYLPQHLLMNVLTTLIYAAHGQGRAALAGKRDALRELPRVLEARRAVQARRMAGARELRREMARGLSWYLLLFRNRARIRRRERAAAASAGFAGARP